MKVLVFVLSFLLSTLAAAAEPTRKDVLKLAARAADWQLARLDAAHITHMQDETRDPKSWEQGAFWVGMTHFADVSGEKRFHDALAELPPIHRDILVLREMEGLSYTEISNITGTAIGTVMSRLSRARAELRRLLSGQSPKDEANAV